VPVVFHLGVLLCVLVFLHQVLVQCSVKQDLFLLLVRLFSTPRLLSPQPDLLSFVTPSTIVTATSLGVRGFIDVSSATCPTQPRSALPQDVDLSSVPESFFPFPSSATTCVNVVSGRIFIFCLQGYQTGSYLFASSYFPFYKSF